MELFLIIALVVLLYVRTLDYKYVIDDNVKRQGYMYEVPLIAPAPNFFDTKPSRWYRLFMIGMHCVNVSVIYLIWGWVPALIFAVHPLGVWGTAWVTGNYYATTAYFILIAFYFLHTFHNVWAALIAMPLYIAALNSTICGLNFPFIFLFGSTPWGLTMILPLIAYLKGKRFTTGIKIREGFVTGKKVKRELKANRLILMTKVVAKYTATALYPDRLGFFGGWGVELMDNPEEYKKMHTANKDFWKALALIAATLGVGLYFNPFGIMWFFVFISLHSQFNLMGQFYAERYLYLAMVGMCVVFGTALATHPILLTVFVTILTIRTHFFIPAWKNMETVWKNDMEAYPDYGEVYSNISQYYMNRQPLPAWRINEVASYLFRGELMCPNSWKIHMNIACFFAVTQQWHMCLQFTRSAIKILEDIGGQITPLDQLKKQEQDIINLLNNAAQAAQQPTAQRTDQQVLGQDTGLNVSPVQLAKPEKVGTDHGQRTTAVKEELAKRI